MRKILLFAAAIAFAFGAFLASCATQAKTVGKSATVGTYRVAFVGIQAEMVWNSGAKPDLPGSTYRPDYYPAVFTKKDSNPFKNTLVRTRYRQLGASPAPWRTLSVVRCTSPALPCTTATT